MSTLYPPFDTRLNFTLTDGAGDPLDANALLNVMILLKIGAVTVGYYSKTVLPDYELVEVDPGDASIVFIKINRAAAKFYKSGNMMAEVSILKADADFITGKMSTAVIPVIPIEETNTQKITNGGF